MCQSALFPLLAQITFIRHAEPFDKDHVHPAAFVSRDHVHPASPMDGITITLLALLLGIMFPLLTL